MLNGTNWGKLDSVNFDSLNIARMELTLSNRQLQFVTLLNEVWGKSANPDTASNGFLACGIYPLSINAIRDNAFLASTVSGVSMQCLQLSIDLCDCCIQCSSYP
jgi:hypothetical protein